VREDEQDRQEARNNRWGRAGGAGRQGAVREDEQDRQGARNNRWGVREDEQDDRGLGCRMTRIPTCAELVGENFKIIFVPGIIHNSAKEIAEGQSLCHTELWILRGHPLPYRTLPNDSAYLRVM
jgi:hypothetical protein